MDNGMSSQCPLGQISQPQLNRDRFIRNVACAPKAQQFDPWMAEQRRQDRLQRQSYIKNQSVLVEPGRVPEAPIYGPSRELALVVGSSLPTIYAQRITVSDVGQVLDENEFLRGKVLERQVKCEICTESFEVSKRTISGGTTRYTQSIFASLGCAPCARKRTGFSGPSTKRKII